MAADVLGLRCRIRAEIAGLEDAVLRLERGDIRIDVSARLAELFEQALQFRGERMLDRGKPLCCVGPGEFLPARDERVEAFPNLLRHGLLILTRSSVCAVRRAARPPRSPRRARRP